MDEQQGAPLRASLRQLPVTTPPEFDLEKYLAMAEDFEMSEAEKAELLSILWDIMKRFVELSFGLDSVSLLGDENAEKPRNDAGFEV